MKTKPFRRGTVAALAITALLLGSGAAFTYRRGDLAGLPLRTVPIHTVLAGKAQKPPAVAVPQTPAETTYPPNTNPEFARSFETVWKTVRDHFYDKNFNGVDWGRLGNETRRRLGDVKTKEEFAALINGMLGELKASHTRYWTDDEVEYSMLSSVMSGDLNGRQVAHIGVMGERVGSDFLVTAVLEGSPAQKAGIVSGDRILSADGKPFMTAGSFRGKEGTTVVLQVQSAGSAARLVTVTPVKENILRAFLNATQNSIKMRTIAGKRIGSIHLWTMGNEAFRRALERAVLGKLHDTDGLILDLRDGYGGMPFGYLDVFLRPDIDWEQQAHSGGAFSNPTGYAKPMVLLVNGGTRSAKEYLTYEFKAARRGLIVGSRTAGAFLGAETFKVGDTELLELAVVGLRLDHNRLEGAGVAPDVPVDPSHSYTEEDVQRKRAEQVLLREIGQRSAASAGGPI